jgi:hypothetical protein
MVQKYFFVFCAALGLAGCGGAQPIPAEPVAEPPEEPAADEEPADDVACESADECNNMGAMALLGGQFELGRKLLEKACELESGAGCSNLAGVFARGDGVDKDLARSAALYLKACELGSGSACTDAGVFHHLGEGVAKDDHRALKLFEKGCDGGDEQGCSNAGILLYQGQGVPQDYQRAAPLFEKACERGVVDGCFNLGVAYLKGNGVTEDRERAAGLFQQACDGGDKDACRVLAEIEQEAADESAGSGTSLGAASMTVNGMTVSDLACDLTGGGLLGTMTIVAGLADRKQALDKCAPKGDTPTVKWTMKGGKTTKVTVSGAASKKIGKCVKKAMKKIRSAVDGTCSAVIHLGQ